MKLRTIALILLLCFCTGKLYAAVEFDGANDYIDFQTISGISAYKGTLTAWVSDDGNWDNTGNFHTIATIGDNNANDNQDLFLIKNSNGNLRAYIDATGTSDISWSGISSWNGEWHFVGVTWDEDHKIRLYADGVEVNNGAISSSSLSNEDFEIGRKVGDNSRWWDGKIDDVRLYNRVLNPLEMETLYRARKKRISGSLGRSGNTEQVLDSSGNNNHGILVNNPLVTTGQTNGGILFDGSEDYVNGSSAFPKTTSPLSFSSWVYADDLSGGPGAGKGLIRSHASDSVGDWQVGINSTGQVVVNVWESAGTDADGRHTTSTTPVATSQWHHVSFTWNGSSTTIYVDGASQAYTDGSTSSGWGNGNQVGRNWTGATYHWDGRMDDVRIYDSALTSNEIRFLYNGSGADPGTSNLQLLWTFDNLSNGGLLAHYELDDLEIGRLAGHVEDSSGNNNYGNYANFVSIPGSKSADRPSSISTGTSMSFGGANNGEVASTAVASSMISANNYSMSVWMKPQGTPPTVIATQTWRGGAFGDASGFFSIGRANITAEGDHVYAYNFPNPDVHVGTTYTVNQWTHLVAVQNGGNLKFFKDGAFVGTAASTGPTTLTGQIKLGKLHSTYPEFEGNLDDCRIYNKPLTANEISFLYNGSGADPGTSNLQLLWTLDASLVKDSTGNNHHGFGFGGTSLKYEAGAIRR